MKNVKFIIAAIVLGLMASCSDDCPTPEKDLNAYYFKAVERYTKLEYNAAGSLYRTEARTSTLAEESGISLEELTLLIEQYDREMVQEVVEGVSVETWIYAVEYNLLR